MAFRFYGFRYYGPSSGGSGPTILPGATFFAPRYWAPNYFAGHYWSGSGGGGGVGPSSLPGSTFWAPRYWGPRYFAPHYWSGAAQVATGVDLLEAVIAFLQGQG